MREVFVGLGANLGDPAWQLLQAFEALRNEAPMLAAGRLSGLYRTPPLGPPDQPDYCNAVAAFRSQAEPESLLALLMSVERRFGRHRNAQRWAPRTLDLDLLWVEGCSRSGPELQLPHPGIALRAFVLVPWAELAPGLCPLPGLPDLAALAAVSAPGGLSRWTDSS